MSRKTLNLADSNLALVGSDIDKKLRAANAVREPSWDGCGKQKGLEIFRIEKFQVKPWPKESYGKFYDGDSYIILQTHSAGVYDVFYWLGTFTSQDEAGAAAIKIIELDDMLGGAPVQHREIQGAETGAFMTLFDGSIDILSGGVESGFQTAADATANRPKRLFHFRSSGGIKSTKMYQCEVDANNLNEDDVFIVDNDRQLYIFQGTTSSPGERMLAASTANRIASNRASGCKIDVVDSVNAPTDFWKLLGGKITVKAKPDPAKLEGKTKSLHRITDTNGGGNLVFSTVVEDAGEKISRSALKSEDAFVLDTGAEVLVWVGSGASGQERMNAMGMAQKYLASKGRPQNTPITRVLEGAEGAFFQEITKE